MIRSGVGDRGSGLLKALRRCRVRILHFTEIFYFVLTFLSAAAIAANQDISTTTRPLTRPQDSSLEDSSLIMPAQFDEGGAFFSEAGFSEVFDSLNWVFDGIPDSFVAPPVL